MARQDPFSKPEVVYNPSTRVEGWSYWEIGRLLRITYERCGRESVKVLCDEALTRSASGRDLRNNYLLPIRVGLQDWHSGIILDTMIKVMLQRILDDTQQHKFETERLRLSTVVAYDLTKDNSRAVRNG